MERGGARRCQMDTYLLGLLGVCKKGMGDCMQLQFYRNMHNARLHPLHKTAE